MVRVEGYKLWVLGQRVHHGAFGIVCMVWGTVLCVHDRADIRDWFRLTIGR